MKDNYFSSHNVTVAVLNYNGVKILPQCFKSIKELNSPPGEMIMVDDCSSDGSPRWVRENHPDVRVIEMGFNSKLLNVIRNRAIMESSFD
ncbi:MAG: glycosyltransferase family 2 protein, partial [bacterium]